MRRPWQLQIAGCRLPIGEKIRSGIWIDTLVQLVANHARWRGVAAGQTLNKFEAAISVRADRDWIMRFFTITGALDSPTRAQIFHHFQSTGHRATERAANPDMGLPGRMLSEHWIKRDHLENVDRLEAEFFRDPEDGFVADESEVFLPQMQERHRRAATVVARITRDRVVHFALQLGGNLDARRVWHQ
jgi:hypothetical protein